VDVYGGFGVSFTGSKTRKYSSAKNFGSLTRRKPASPASRTVTSRETCPLGVVLRLGPPIRRRNPINHRHPAVRSQRLSNLAIEVHATGYFTTAPVIPSFSNVCQCSGSADVRRASSTCNTAMQHCTVALCELSRAHHAKRGAARC
jgi:hypothetical protein